MRSRLAKYMLNNSVQKKKKVKIGKVRYTNSIEMYIFLLYSSSQMDEEIEKTVTLLSC